MNDFECRQRPRQALSCAIRKVTSATPNQLRNAFAVAREAEGEESNRQLLDGALLLLAEHLPNSAVRQDRDDTFTPMTGPFPDTEKGGEIRSRLGLMGCLGFTTAAATSKAFALEIGNHTTLLHC